MALAARFLSSSFKATVSWNSHRHSEPYCSLRRFADLSYSPSLYTSSSHRPLLYHFPSPQVIRGHFGRTDRQELHCSYFAHTNVTSTPKPLVRIIITALAIICSFPVLSCGCAQAAETIKASRIGLNVAAFLRSSGWQDEIIVFVMAMLPVLELRGAIPVGYWMQLDPLKVSLLSILGNMAPVPFIILYLEKLAKLLSDWSPTAEKIVERLFESTRKKAKPIHEFEWLGLMLFVAVPFPGTGAWTGAMAASVLGMPFWEALSANFFGVIMAGILVNLLVNLGLKYAFLVGVALFLVSTFMWSILRMVIKNKK